MIDLNVLRENTDQVKKSLKNRGFELDVDFFQQLEQQRKDIQIKTQDIQQERNSLSKQSGYLRQKAKIPKRLCNKSHPFRQEQKIMKFNYKIFSNN